MEQLLLKSRVWEGNSVVDVADRSRAFHSDWELRNTFTKAFENKDGEK